MSTRSGPSKVFDLGKFIIVKLRKGKHTFEMIADPEAAWKAKKILQDRIKDKKDVASATPEQILKDPDISLSDIYPSFEIFSDLKKAIRVTDEEMIEAFQITDTQLIAATILLEGDFAWTKAQRDSWFEQKRKQIVTILARNCINPQTKKPHPPQRIEKAIEEAHVALDLNKTAEEQIEDVLKKIAAVIPIRMETIEMAVKIPPQYAAKAYSTIEKYSHIKQSEWANDGSWVGMVTMPAGLQSEFLEKLNNLTHGRMQTKLVQ